MNCAEGKSFVTQSLTSADILAQHFIHTSSRVTSSLHLSIPSPFSACVCQWQGSVGVCVLMVTLDSCVWTCVGILTFVLLEAENHIACGFSARHSGLGWISFETLSNPASHLVCLQECYQHSGFTVSLCWPKNFLFVRVCLTPSFGPCCVILADLLPSFSPSDSLPVFHLLASFGSPPPPSFLLQQHSVSRGHAAVPAINVYVSPTLLALSACLYSHPSTWSQPNSGDVSVPKTACIFLSLQTNSFFSSSPSSSLNSSLFTGWASCTGDSWIQIPAGILTGVVNPLHQKHITNYAIWLNVLSESCLFKNRSKTSFDYHQFVIKASNTIWAQDGVTGLNWYLYRFPSLNSFNRFNGNQLLHTHAHTHTGRYKVLQVLTCSIMHEFTILFIRQEAVPFPPHFNVNHLCNVSNL